MVLGARREPLGQRSRSRLTLRETEPEMTLPEYEAQARQTIKEARAKGAVYAFSETERQIAALLNLLDAARGERDRAIQAKTEEPERCPTPEG